MKKEMDALRKKIQDLQEDVFSKRYWLINHWLFLFFSTVHSPLFFRKIYIAKIQRFAFWAAIALVTLGKHEAKLAARTGNSRSWRSNTKKQGTVNSPNPQY